MLYLGEALGEIGLFSQQVSYIALSFIAFLIDRLSLSADEQILSPPLLYLLAYLAYLKFGAFLLHSSGIFQIYLLLKFEHPRTGFFLFLILEVLKLLCSVFSLFEATNLDPQLISQLLSL
jgi:hypothetical protein